MPIELQVKLLRVLETGMFMRVGTTKELETDVRLIAATNRDPEQAVLEGKLRLDLYHRLNVFPINLPPLRERGTDVELLGQAFLDELNSRYNTKKTFPKTVHDMLASYPWPGNVRELKNYVQRAYIMSGAESDSTATVPLQISLSKPSTGTSVTIPLRNLARRGRSSVDSRDTRAMRRRQDAGSRDPGHQPEDAFITASWSMATRRTRPPTRRRAEVGDAG